MANYPKREYTYVILGIALGIFFFAAYVAMVWNGHSALNGWLWVSAVVSCLMLGLIMFLCSISLVIRIRKDTSTFDNESVFSSSETFEKPSGPDTYTLTIRQDPQFYLVKLGFRVVVDDSVEKRLKNQSDVAYIDLLRGEHTLDIRGSIRAKKGHIYLERDTTMFLSWDRFTGSIRFRFERT
ncbi:MAG: hypothetical protein WC248_01050 [Candidatus Methanomethylophilaceae archaeon]|jgi:hypothetical protein